MEKETSCRTEATTIIYSMKMAGTLEETSYVYAESYGGFGVLDKIDGYRRQFLELLVRL